MPHAPPRFSILDLDDPIDRQIAKIDLTIQALMGRSGLGGRTNLDILREAGIGGVGALRLTALELFTSITLPDFLAPLEFVPDPPPTDPVVDAIKQELELRQSFTNLLGESLPVLSEGTGREDLTRGST